MSHMTGIKYANEGKQIKHSGQTIAEIKKKAYFWTDSILTERYTCRDTLKIIHRSQGMLHLHFFR
jgi:hypothetical protein